jgi:hypothetical protein
VLCANYTWSVALDRGGSSPQDLLNYAPDCSRAAIDSPRRFLIHYVWQAPSPVESGIGRPVLNGW